MSKPRRPKVTQAAADLDAHIDSLVSAFQDNLQGIVSRAQARTLAELRKTLTFDGDQIRRTAANTRAVRKAADIFTRQMDAAGYQRLVDAYVGQFSGLLPLFQDTLRAITETWNQPPPPVEFTATDLRLFAEQQVSTKLGLADVVETIASQATGRALFSVAGLSFSDLVVTLANQFSKTIPQAVSLASTALPTFYRTVADRGYQIIEQDLPSEQVRYTYEGPLDKLTRPFCRRLLQRKKAYTREEIGRMDNGQLPNVMLTCGGWLCRHQWVLWVDRP